MDLGIKNKVIMVAASSRGLGWGIARQAALEGAIVYMGSRRTEQLDEAARKIREEIKGAQIISHSLDVSDANSIGNWVRHGLRLQRRIDGLVINGGGPPAGRFDDMDDAEWQAGYENTLMSAVRLIRAVLPAMRKQHSGSILSITSSSVKEPIDNLLLSNVYRSGVTSLVKSLSFELAREGIRINNLIPGFFDTNRLRELDLINSRNWRMNLEQVRQVNFEKIPLGRYGTTEEFGKAALFLLSEAASYVNGESFVIDGGKMRSLW